MTFGYEGRFAGPSAGGPPFGQAGVSNVLLDPFGGARVQIQSAANLLPRMIKSLSSWHRKGL